MNPYVPCGKICLLYQLCQVLIKINKQTKKGGRGSREKKERKKNILDVVFCC